MAKATICRLPVSAAPWSWSLHITTAESSEFEPFIGSLKVNIGSRGRKWEPIDKCWWLRHEYIELVENLLQRYGFSYDIDSSTYQEHPQSHRQLMSREQAAAELHLLPSAPPEVVTAVYKTLAKAYHPDRGGDLAKMQKLNAAVEVLR